jgi:LmbE family N-acetylglucosaminyl deacetylase
MVEFHRGQAMTRTVAVIAAHPDDEVLGCGGVIARRAQQGDRVHVLIVAEGATSRGATRNREESRSELSGLADAAAAANRILGSASVELLQYPDNRLDTVALLDVAKSIEGFIERYGPQTVYTHFGGDLNRDHQIVSEATQIACRPLPNSGIRELLMFEVASSTGWRAGVTATFSPNYFYDISATLGLKLRALSAYAAEMRPWPHARSIEAVDALAKWRGSSVGLAAAEAFVLERRIMR